MTASSLEQLRAQGQSVWCDGLRRLQLDTGDLEQQIQAGLAGVLSVPEVLRLAILAGQEYDQGLGPPGSQEKAVLEAVRLEDAARAADLLRPIYQSTHGADGYVSVWLDPELVEDAEAMVEQASRLLEQVDRPNLMIDVPATPAGLQAMRRLVAMGHHVNATQVFSVELYQQVAEAHVQGMIDFAGNGGDPAAPACVVTMRLNVLDNKVDRILAALGADGLQAALLRGRSGIALARATHAHRREIYRRSEWSRLAEAGARIQRLLFAGTLPLDPDLPETHFLQATVGPETVCAVSADGWEALRRWGGGPPTLEEGLEGTQQRMQALSDLGVNMAEVGRELKRECLAAARQEHTDLLQAIRDRREGLASGWRPVQAMLNGMQQAVEAGLGKLETERVLPRIWQRDHTVWHPDPTEISNRLGWLRAADIMQAQCYRLDSLAAAFRADGYRRVVLLGMGGSSLAPEMLSRIFGTREGYPQLSVLDSTVPDTIHALADELDLPRTAFIVSSKSGTTQETLSLFKFFYRRIVQAQGEWRAGEHFLIITDPGSPLATLAERLHLRAALLNDPNLGGRYSALSYFGLAPAAVTGVDVGRVLDRARQAASGSERWAPAADNPAARLGTILAEAARAGRDKLTLVTSSGLESIGDWVEQLIAESTGKRGTGILPVVGEAPGSAEVYGQDRLFVQLQLSDQPTAKPPAAPVGHPAVQLALRDTFDLGAQFFLWEMATAVAGHLLSINPFDQPNVEAAKALARQVVEMRRSQAPPPEEPPAAIGDGLALYSGSSELPGNGASVPSILSDFLAGAQPGGYLALQAYLQPTPAVVSALGVLRRELRDRTRLAITLGYGPRYLHSTGQLHKGDAGKGLFLQFTANDRIDLDIPDEPDADEASLTFGALKVAQAQGDRLALLQAGRQVIRVHLGSDPAAGLERLRAALG